jgi:dipicolinate synthase subunit B
MKRLENVRLGFALTGSFCTLDDALESMVALAEEGADITPILSFSVDQIDTKFGTAAKWKKKIAEITERQIINSITLAEPIGPAKTLDILVILPASGNTLARLAAGIADTPVTMAAKAHLRNNAPVVLGISSNDALGIGARNIAQLLAMRNIYFVPYGQDNAHAKPRSMVYHKRHVVDAVLAARDGKQFQPMII